MKPETKMKFRKGMNRAIDIVIIGIFVYGVAGIAMMIKGAIG